MLVSTTLNFNAVAPIDAVTWRPYTWPMPGLRTVHNRGEWLSRHLTKDGTDWTLADAWVDGNIAQGLQPLARLTDDPSVPFDEDAWADYCRRLATRYLGRVHFYECANEIDTEGSWCFDGNENGTTAGRAWRATTDSIRSVDPEAAVICGSIQSIWPTGHGLQTLAGALRAFGPELPSDIGIHAYPSPSEVASTTRVIERVRGACRAHAKGDPRIWVTEWSLWPAQFSGMAAKSQAAFLKEMLRQFRAAGVYASLHYLFDDPNGFGFKDRKSGKSVWNAAVYAIQGKA